MLKPGEKVRVRNAHDGVVRSAEGDVVVVLVEMGGRKVSMRFKASEVEASDANDPVEGPAGRIDGIVFSGPADGAAHGPGLPHLDYTALLSQPKVRAGILTLREGRIVACDPFVSGIPPFARQVEAGSWPVDLVLAADRVAAAAIIFGEITSTTRWEPALAVGQDPARLEPFERYGYGVDRGIGCFADAAVLEEDRESKALGKSIERAVKSRPAGPAWRSGGTKAGAALVAFSSGLGDGNYRSFWGLESDRVVALVTDFDLLYDEETWLLDFPDARRFSRARLQHFALDAAKVTARSELRRRRLMVEFGGLTTHAEQPPPRLVSPAGEISFAATNKEGGGVEVDANGRRTRAPSIWEFDLDAAPPECTTLRVGVRTGSRPRDAHQANVSSTTRVPEI